MAPYASTSKVTLRWGPGIYLAWSLDRKTSLASDLFAVGPRGGRQHRYAVRLGIDESGVAVGGCCLFKTREEADECFLRYAAAPPPRATYGGTAACPDSIDVEAAR